MALLPLPASIQHVAPLAPSFWTPTENSGKYFNRAGRCGSSALALAAAVNVGRTKRSGKCRCKSLPSQVETVPTDGQMKEELLKLLKGKDGSWDSTRAEAAQRVEDLVAELSECYARRGKAASKELLEGRWKLLSTFVPGQAAANPFSVKSWSEYIFGKGPSPVQAAAFTNDAVQKVYQALDLTASPGRWYNVIDALPFGILCLEADLELGDKGLQFQWTGGRIVIRRPPWTSEDLDEPLKLPYPVPFKLLGDRARGDFDTMYVDDDLRISRGSKSGSIFVLARERGKLPLEAEYYVAAKADG